MRFHLPAGDSGAGPAPKPDPAGAIRIGRGRLPLPLTLNVHLPRYDQIVHVRDGTDQAGHPTINFTSDAASPDLGTDLAVFSAPDLLFISSRAVAPHPAGHTDPAPYAVADLLEDTALGVTLHEMMHWLHFQNQPKLYVGSVGDDVPGRRSRDGRRGQ